MTVPLVFRNMWLKGQFEDDLVLSQKSQKMSFNPPCTKNLKSPWRLPWDVRHIKMLSFLNIDWLFINQNYLLFQNMWLKCRFEDVDLFLKKYPSIRPGKRVRLVLGTLFWHNNNIIGWLFIHSQNSEIGLRSFIMSIFWQSSRSPQVLGLCICYVDVVTW
jgi:hypothetical protein